MSNPRTAIAVFLSLAVLGGCSQTPPQGAEPSNKAAATAGATPEAKNGDKCPTAAGFHYSPYPAGLHLQQPYQVRVDRIYTTKDGVERRHSTLELLEGDAGSAKDALVSQLETKGFHVMDAPQKGDGIVRTGLVRPRAGRINLSSSDRVGDKPANPHAVGLVSLDWPVALDQNMAAAPDAAH